MHRYSALLCAISLSIPPCHGHDSFKASSMLRSSCGKVPFDAASSEAVVLHLPWAPGIAKVLYSQVCDTEGLGNAQITFLRAAGVAIPQTPRHVGTQDMLHAPSGGEADHYSGTRSIRVWRWLQPPKHSEAQVEGRSGKGAPSFCLHLIVMRFDLQDILELVRQGHVLVDGIAARTCPREGNALQAIRSQAPSVHQRGIPEDRRH
jgi:hypothetical protein